MRVQYGVNRRCQRAVLISVERPCSTKINRPPGLRTRRISVSAAIGFGIEHKVQVITIVSNTTSATGRFSEEARSNDTGMTTFSRPSTREPQQFGGWIETKDVGDCRAIERQVHPRPDADLKNQTSRRLDRSLAIMVEQPVTHGEVEQAGHDPMLVKPYHRDLRGHSSSVHTDTCAGDDRDQGRDWKGFDRTNLVYEPRDGGARNGLQRRGM